MDTRGGDQNPFSFVERREEEDPEVRSRVTRRRRSFFSLSFSFSRVFVDDRKMMMMFASNASGSNWKTALKRVQYSRRAFILLSIE
jgi:hypothetical protein